MKLNMTLAKLAAVTGGTLKSADSQQKIDALVTDSRVVGAGDAFWALRGQQYDAHEFIAEVLKKGAKVIVSEPGRVPATAAPDVSILEVKNTLKALQELARYHRLNSTLKVAAITGSNGKSTTKQMLKSICAQAGETVANMGNFNNQFGVPFSLLEIQPKHKYGVFELGASHPGDIAETACLAVPDAAVITNVSAAHLEFFKDLETVYRTKTEIVDCIAPGGTLIYNADDALLSRLSEYKGKSISFGFSPNADFRLLETEDFSFIYKGEAYVIPLRLMHHNKLNAAAACAAALALGLFMDDITKGLLSFTPMPMRLERVSKDGHEFILDCYNANPASMQNALNLLGQEKASVRIAVLGDMKELGDSAKDYHRLVSRWLRENQIEYAFLAGPEMKYAAEVLKTDPAVKSFYALEPQGWIQELKAVLTKHSGAVCLFKASRSMQFENLFKEI